MELNIVVISLQIVMVLLSVFVIKITGYQLVWILISFTAILKTVSNIIFLASKSIYVPESIITIIIKIIPFVITLLVLIIFVLLLRLYRSLEFTNKNLAKEGKKVKKIFDLADVLVVSYDSEGIITEINKTGCNLLGYEDDELVGKNWFDTVQLAENRISIKVKYAKIINKEILHDESYEEVVRTKAGERINITWHSTMIRDEKDRIAGALCSGIDITHLKQIEEHLLTLSAAIEQSPSIVVITDLDGNIEYVNPKFTEITGYGKDEVMGSNPRILKSGHFHDSTYKELWNTISSGNEWRGEFHNKKKNGELYWEAASISSIKDGEGKIKNYLAVKEDITERRNIEEVLKKSEKRLMDVQRMAHIGTWEWANGDKKAFWSDENYRLLGLEPGEIEPGVGTFKSFIHPDDRERVLRTAEKSRKDHTENNSIFRILLRDGKVKYVNDWTQNFYNQTGEHLYATGMMQDITQRIANEERIRISLEEKNALLMELYHRTKNNMQVISSMLNLNSLKIDDKRVSEVFSEMNNRIQSMSLVHEKLYQSKNLSSINLKEYITDLCLSLSASYYRSNCDVLLKFDLDDVSVMIDAAIPLGLIINELVSNSFKHAFPDKEMGQISIKLIGNEDSNIKIIIADNGIGTDSSFNVDNLKTIGLQTTIAIGRDQLKGNIEMDTSSGFMFSLEFRTDAFKSRV